MRQPKFIISGGGTGGHIFPAVAIGLALQERFPKAKILFVGALGKMEMTKVPQAGFPIKGLWIDGLQRSLSLRNVLFPLKFLLSLWQSLLILLRFRPAMAIGTGGFASGSLLLVAQWLKIPTLIQEQNSLPGITNKILAKKARKICVAYPQTERFFSKDRMVVTGNPIRKNISALEANKEMEQAKEFFDLKGTKKVLAVLGGSLGAAKINSLIAKEKEWIVSQGFQILWQCGSLYYEQYESLADENVVVSPFVKEMNAFYQAADIIVSRAGAGTLSELTCVGKPILLIPSPNVAENHQMHNAMALAEKGAALVIEEKTLSEKFQPTFESLANDTAQQKKMGKKLRMMAKPEATTSIIREIELLLQ